MAANGDAPSNIHDNAYAFGTVDFTGDMPVILGPDGPSLGGFVCPATVISADLWKIGQLAAGDTIRFIAVTTESAVSELMLGHEEVTNLRALAGGTVAVADYTPSVESVHLDGLRSSSDAAVTVGCWSNSERWCWISNYVFGAPPDVIPR